MVGWKGNLLSVGDRVTLTNSCLSSIPLYMLSFLEALKGVLEKMDTPRARMVWQENKNKRKYHVVNWPGVSMPKDCEGLGVLDLETMNKSLICKWLWKLEISEGIWQQILYKNTFRTKPWPRLELHLVALIFGKAWWESSSYSSNMLRGLLEMGLKHYFVKIFGLEMNHLLQNSLGRMMYASPVKLLWSKLKLNGGICSNSEELFIWRDCR